MKTLAIIGARLNSSRLPGKHLLSLAGKPLIERVQERLRCARLVDNIVVATTADGYNQALVDWATAKSISVSPYSGDVNDLMGRLNSVIEKLNPQYIVYICGDCPLIEPKFIDHALSELISSPSHDSIILQPGVQSLHEGMAFYSRAGWDKLYAVSQSDMSREHVGYADKLTPVLNKLAIADSADYSKIKHRISVDTPADYRFMSEVYDRWYQNHDHGSIVDLSWVQEQLLTDKLLEKINLHVQQKQPEHHYQSVSLYCHASKYIGMGHLKRSAIIADTIQEYLSLGTIIHIHGEVKSLNWLHSNVVWHDSELSLLAAIEQDSAKVKILDFNPKFINVTTWYDQCDTQKKRGSRILAIDNLACLLDVVDELYIPAFFSKIHHPRVSYGWENYIFKPPVGEKKKNEILVLTGGGDSLGYGERLPAVLESIIPSSYTIHWVQGPYAKAPLIPQSPRWVVSINPPDVASLIAGAGMILTCYGMSLFEAITSGSATFVLPSFAICDQEELIALKRLNCCYVPDDLNEMVGMIKQTIETPDNGSNQTILAQAKKYADMVDGISLIAEKVRTLSRGPNE
jgi:Spore coat polysaccharide biosynthesis protein F, CMP-KDO synthetase homolog